MSGYFATMRQGNIVRIADETGELDDFVVVSQSCDASQPKREIIQLAPLIVLDDLVERRAAMGRENPRYPIVVQGENEKFADLAKIFSVSKAVVEGASTTPGVCADGERSERGFGLAIGRWFGRFAVPDDLQPWLEPLQTVVHDKYERPESNLGRALSRVVELRVQADWKARPAEVILHVIVAASEFPSMDGERDSDMHDFTPPAATSLDGACARLLAVTGGQDKYPAWLEVADELAKRCRPRAKHLDDRSVASAVSGVVSRVWPDDEFPLSLYRKSEILDIDFLSDPTPL
jgi:hypothetical protein